MGRREGLAELETKIAVRPHIAHFENINLRNHAGRESNTFKTNGSMILSFQVRAEQPTKPLDLLVVFQFQTGTVVEEFFASDRGFSPVALDKERCQVTLTFEPLMLLGGDYTIEVTAFEAGDPEAVLGISPSIEFHVQSQCANFDVYPAYVPVEFELR
jgi:hypothetical protein